MPCPVQVPAETVALLLAEELEEDDAMVTGAAVVGAAVGTGVGAGVATGVARVCMSAFWVGTVVAGVGSGVVAGVGTGSTAGVGTGVEGVVTVSMTRWSGLGETVGVGVVAGSPRSLWADAQ